MISATRRYRFTADQYHRMGEAEIFHPGCRVELVDGEIFEMTPVDPWHAGVVNRLTHLFHSALADRAVVHVQNPLEAERYSEPQPDVVLLRPRADFYGTSHPRPEDAFLLVEVSSTSLRHDRGRKLPLYARTGVPEVWIVNRQDDAIEVFRKPSPDGYQERSTVARGERVAPSAFPQVRISADDILG
jgi:Uma2 family endonuclease